MASGKLLMKSQKSKKCELHQSRVASYTRVASCRRDAALRKTTLLHVTLTTDLLLAHFSFTALHVHI